MTLPRIISASEAGLGQNLAQIVETFNSVLNPNKRFNAQMKAMFLEKPELMQKFVDVEKANPGTLKAFGFSDEATDLLTGMQESIPALKSRVLGPAVAEELQRPESRTSAARQEVTGQTPGQEAADQVGAFVQSKLFNAYQSDPDLMKETISKLATGQTTLERLQSEREGADIRSSDEIERLDPMSLAKGTLNGSIPQDQLGGLFSANPNRKLAYEAALAKIRLDAEINSRVAIANLRSRDVVADQVMRGKINDVTIQRRSADGTESLAAWASVLYPGEDLGFGKATTEEVKSVNNTLKAAQRNAAVRQKADFSRALFRDLSELQENVQDDKVREALTANLNETLSSFGSTWTASVASKGGLAGFFGADAVYFRNEITGQVTTDVNAILSGTPADPNRTVNPQDDGGLTQAILAEVANLRRMTPEQKSIRLEQIRVSDPAIYARVQQLLGEE